MRHRFRRYCGTFCCISVCLSWGVLSVAQDFRSIEPSSTTGSSLAVVVGDVPLVHTGQLFYRDDPRDPTDSVDVIVQTQRLLTDLSAVITAAGGRADHVVKLNIYVSRQDSVTAVESVLSQRFSTAMRPAVSVVTTRLPRRGDLIALDAIAIGKPDDEPTVRYSSQAAVMPPGSRIYISGQAEKGANLAEATRLTLESLRKSWQHLGRTDSDVVQLKAFLSPMVDVAQAQQAVAEFFGDSPKPPISWVEWHAPLIEIEAVVWGGERRSGPAIEFLTLPDMTNSPVYSRATRTNAEQLIYVCGLRARQPTDATGEIIDIFDQLGGALRQTASDFRHLVKATYYCSTEESSAKLNELRPRYYDPTRPPAASKAMVTGVGRSARSLNMDMIAVPAAN